MREDGYIYRLRDTASWRQAYEPLAEAGLFPQGSTWWFAWNAVECVLPSVWKGPDDVGEGWEHFRVFSPAVELRVVQRAGSPVTLLLSEGDLVPQITQLVDGKPEVFEVREGYRILRGGKLRLPEGEVRGEVVCPRIFRYGIEPDDLARAVVAEVRSYWRDGLWFADRYCRLVLMKPGSVRLDAGEKQSEEG